MPETPGAREAKTYARLAPDLQRIVAYNLHAPQSVIEDACQIAWGQWLVHQREVAPGSVLAWLTTTATREALRLLRPQSRQVSLGVPSSRSRSGTGAGLAIAPAAPGSADDDLGELPETSAGPQEIIEFRERLAELRRLPARQQRMMWLQGLGYDYREIGARTGESERTVQRQLLRARLRLAERPQPTARSRAPAAHRPQENQS